MPFTPQTKHFSILHHFSLSFSVYKSKNIEIHLSLSSFLIRWVEIRAESCWANFCYTQMTRPYTQEERFLCKFDDVLIRSFVKKIEERKNISVAVVVVVGNFPGSSFKWKQKKGNFLNISINKFYANCVLKPRPKNKSSLCLRVRLQFQWRHQVFGHTTTTIVKSISSMQNDDSRKMINGFSFG